jgi:UDP-N-acetylmuramate--alanine ligase
VTDWSQRKLHFIAIGGAGMSGLALVCARLGAEVSGSDRAESSYLARLRSAGLEPRIGHDAQAVPGDAEVVVSTAIADDNPELAIARSRGQRIIHRGELLAELCAAKRLIAVAGTHGKTTTAGMIVHALRAAGAEAAFFLGGELPTEAGPVNAGWGEGEWVVAEADESDASFLEMKPEVAAITNVELDHHARWGSRAELLNAFRSFAEPAAGLALLDDPALDPVVAGQQVLRFGAWAMPPHARRQREGWRPDPQPKLQIPGRHNRLNAEAALAAIELAGLDTGAAAEALARFPGMVRRLERKGAWKGAEVYDDYAHHPTEVAAALEALRELGSRRLVAVFQPHLYSRTKALAGRFGAALAAADAIGVLDVYPAREEPVGPLEGVSGRSVATAAADHAGGRPVWWLRDLATATEVLRGKLREGDLLVTLGAGDVFRVADELVGGGDG